MINSQHTHFWHCCTIPYHCEENTPCIWRGGGGGYAGIISSNICKSLRRRSHLSSPCLLLFCCLFDCCLVYEKGTISCTEWNWFSKLFCTLFCTALMKLDSYPLSSLPLINYNTIHYLMYVQGFVAQKQQLRPLKNEAINGMVWSASVLLLLQPICMESGSFYQHTTKGVCLGPGN